MKNIHSKGISQKRKGAWAVIETGQGIHESYQTCEEGGEGLIAEGERKEWFFARENSGSSVSRTWENVTFLTAFMFWFYRIQVRFNVVSHLTFVQDEWIPLIVGQPRGDHEFSGWGKTVSKKSLSGILAGIAPAAPVEPGVRREWQRSVVSKPGRSWQQRRAARQPSDSDCQALALSFRQMWEELNKFGGL